MTTRSFQFGALAFGLFFLQGCSALNAFEDALEDAGWAQFDRSDRAELRGRVQLLAYRGAGWIEGLGAIVSDRHVWTVAHVVEGATKIEVSIDGRLTPVTAKVVRRIEASPEAIVELELERRPGVFGFEGFGKEHYEVASGAPATQWRADGLFTFPCQTRSGDSGGPLLDEAGRLVGLWVGRLGSAPVWVSVPSSSDREAPRERDRRAPRGLDRELPAPALLARAR